VDFASNFPILTPASKNLVYRLGKYLYENNVTHLKLSKHTMAFMIYFLNNFERGIFFQFEFHRLKKNGRIFSHDHINVLYN
jgi:hypothetical protein